MYNVIRLFGMLTDLKKGKKRHGGVSEYEACYKLFIKELPILYTELGWVEGLRPIVRLWDLGL